MVARVNTGSAVQQMRAGALSPTPRYTGARIAGRPFVARQDQTADTRQTPQLGSVCWRVLSQSYVLCKKKETESGMDDWKANVNRGAAPGTSRTPCLSHSRWQLRKCHVKNIAVNEADTLGDRFRELVEVCVLLEPALLLLTLLISEWNQNAKDVIDTMLFKFKQEAQKIRTVTSLFVHTPFDPAVKARESY